MDMNLDFLVDSLNTICWWVDALYGAHMDLEFSTGMMMSLGVGVGMSLSRGQTLNLRLFMECGIDEIGQGLPQTIRSTYYIEEHGCTVNHKNM